MKEFQSFFERKKLFFFGVLIAFIVAILDLSSKKLVVAILQDISFKNNIDFPQIEIFSFFNIVYVLNKGVSFGMFSNLENSYVIFSFVQSSIILILFFWLFFNQKKYTSIALGLVIGGAFGNVIDRIQNGGVTDFLDFYIDSYHWPAFNIADSFVFIGVFLLVFEDIFLKNKIKK